MNKNHYAIIMAGGIGSRFWPVSTWAFPKQFHDMLGTGQTLLQRTYQRLANFIPKEILPFVGMFLIVVILKIFQAYEK